MLFDEIKKFSLNMFSCYGDNCGLKRCNHPSGECSGSCKNCLDQVHWGPTLNERVDYDCPKLIYSYVNGFLGRYENNMLTLLNDIDLSRYPCFNVLSIGCGAAPDLMALELVRERKPIFYKGYDRNPLWEDIHNCIEEYANAFSWLEADLYQKDIFEAFDDGIPKDEEYNVVVIQYLISHLYNTDQIDDVNILYQGIINLLSYNRLDNSPFLIIINDIDTLNKGRNKIYLLLNRLESAGFSGRATAYSKYPNGDLGEKRWGNCETTLGCIEYTYKATPDTMEGAALVIELE